jgi:hypothetical protein
MTRGKIEWEFTQDKKLVVSFSPPFDLVPEEALEHIKTAGKEMALAMNSLSAKEARKAKKPAGTSRRRTKIELE